MDSNNEEPINPTHQQESSNKFTWRFMILLGVVSLFIQYSTKCSDPNCLNNQKIWK
ncbi:MAG: hypothetical protein P8Y97_16575 [Candidatus Lokiarchaeota archaeon]